MLSAPRRVWLVAFALGLLALSIPTGSAVAAPKPPAVKVPAAQLVTVDGAPLWSRDSAGARPVASTIKLLNALVVRERASLDETVTVAARAAAVSEGGIGIVAGQKLTVGQLLDMMLIASANDAASALAIHVSGSERRHVERMNAKAKQIGLTGTVAVDPHGLGKKERSTPRDLTVLGRRTMADSTLRRIVAKKKVALPRPGKKPLWVPSTNHLLGSYGGISGVKTGYTRPAGYCLVASAKRGGVELVGVVLDAPTLDGRFREMRRLLDWGFAHTRVRTLVTSDTTMAVSWSAEAFDSTIVARPAWTVRRALLDGNPLPKRVIRPAAGVTPPVAVGKRVGMLDLKVGSVVLASVPLIAASDPSNNPTETPTVAGGTRQ
ncbi:MAG: serine hydrolase [Coriobacteriia bacterium]|nr:serine hydrolase [Coriobacteriia bacterium]